MQQIAEDTIVVLQCHVSLVLYLEATKAKSQLFLVSKVAIKCPPKSAQIE